MTQNLFAVCKNNGNISVKRVPLNHQVQQDVYALFKEQETDFIRDVEKIPLESNWNPDEGELLTVKTPENAIALLNVGKSNVTRYPLIDTKNFHNEKIKALFICVSENGQTRLLVQKFTARQTLSRKFMLLEYGDSFKHFDGSVFALGTSLLCIIESEKIKFKKQYDLASIIDIQAITREAANPDIENFSSHKLFMGIGNNQLKIMSNQGNRKLIYEILNKGTLDNHTPQEISSLAKKTKLMINLKNNKIVIPDNPKDIKALLQFLAECRFNGLMSQKTYVTNSTRPADK